MILTKRLQLSLIPAFLSAALLVAPPVQADDYRDARAELFAAYQQANYSAMQLAAEKALAARPGYPGALFNLALAYALNEQHEASLQTLTTLLMRGVDLGAANLDEFAKVRELAGWPEYAAKVARLNEPLGNAQVAATYGDAHFVPEGLALDDRQQFYVGSIRKAQLIRLSQHPAMLSDREGHWSVFGMRFHPDGSLWFASAATPELQDVGADRGKTGLFRLDVTTGTITQAAILPPYEEEQVLGDLIIADANTLYATDSLTGAVYRYYIDSNEFDILVERGRLGSAQGLVLDKTGAYLYVADYIGGLYRVSLQDGSLFRLAVPDDITDYGIDGLYRDHGRLIAIQNGVLPNRVAALHLSDDGLAITGGEVLAANLDAFDEPTLGLIRGDDFYFVANSHWNRFDAEHQLPDGLSGPVILKLSLR